MFTSYSYPRYQFMDGPSEPPSPLAESPTKNPSSEPTENPAVFTPPSLSSSSAESSSDNLPITNQDEPVYPILPGSSRPNSRDGTITPPRDAPTSQIPGRPPSLRSEATNSATAQPVGSPSFQNTEQPLSSTPTRQPSTPISTGTTSSLQSSDLRTTPNNDDWYEPMRRNARPTSAQLGRPPPQSPPRHIQIARNDPRPSHSKSRKLLSKSWRNFKHWLHLVWLDLLAMVIGLVITELINKFATTFRKHNRYIPMVYNPISEMWEGPVWLDYPRLGDDSLSATIGSKLGISSNGFVLVPILVGFILAAEGFVVIGFMQLWVRDGWDFTAATLGTLKCMITT